MALAVCAACNRALSIEKTGVDVIQTRGPERKPYKLWRADLYRCRGCGSRVVAGFAARPQSEEGATGFLPLVELIQTGAYGDPVVYEHEVPV